MGYTKDRERFIYQMALECGMPLANVYRALRAASTIQRAAEVDCSVNIPDTGRVTLRARVRRAVEAIGAVCPLGWTFDAGGDPRGYVVHLYRPGETESSVGVAVPGKGYTAAEMDRLCRIYNDRPALAGAK